MVQIDILMDVRGIIALARSYADYVSLNTYEAKEYVTSERPAALLIQYLIALSSSLCSSGCASGPNGVRASGFKGGVGGLSEGVPWQLHRSAEGHKTREENACLCMMEISPPWASRQSPVK